jgi:hypothetical protein
MTKANEVLNLWQDDVNDMIMYRGVKSGNPDKIGGPSFFSSEEEFAKTNGKTSAFKLNVKNPKIIDKRTWSDSVGSWDNMRPDAQKMLVKSLRDEGFDSVVCDYETMWLAFVIDPNRTKLV